MTRWEVMQGVPGDSATIRLTMSRYLKLNRNSHDMWPSSSVSGLVCVTRRDNCLGKCWLIGTHADIISQEMWCLYEESSSSCLYFAGMMGSLWDAEAFEVSMTLITRSELRAPGDQGVKVTSNVYFHIWWYLHIGGDWGFEVGLLTYLSLKQMEKVSFLNPKCPFLHLRKLANTRNSIRKDFSL